MKSVDAGLLSEAPSMIIDTPAFVGAGDKTYDNWDNDTKTLSKTIEEKVGPGLPPLRDLLRRGPPGAVGPQAHDPDLLGDPQHHPLRGLRDRDLVVLRRHDVDLRRPARGRRRHRGGRDLPRGGGGGLRGAREARRPRRRHAARGPCPGCGPDHASAARGAAAGLRTLRPGPPRGVPPLVRLDGRRLPREAPAVFVRPRDRRPDCASRSGPGPATRAARCRSARRAPKKVGAAGLLPPPPSGSRAPPGAPVAGSSDPASA